MEPLVSAVQHLLLNWYQITVDNLAYFFAVVFISNIILGSILAWSHRNKIVILTSKFEAAKFLFEQEKLKVKHQLEGVEQQWQQSKVQLSEAHECIHNKDNEIEKITQAHQSTQLVAARAVGLELQVDRHHTALAQLMKNLESSLHSQSLPLITDKLDADELWQRHEGVVHQLIERLHTQQREAVELQHKQHALENDVTGKQAIIQELQDTLEAQNTRISGLYHEIQEQKHYVEQEISKFTTERDHLEQEKHTALAALAAQQHKHEIEIQALVDRPVRKAVFTETPIVTRTDDVTSLPAAPVVVKAPVSSDVKIIKKTPTIDAQITTETIIESIVNVVKAEVESAAEIIDSVIEPVIEVVETVTEKVHQVVDSSVEESHKPSLYTEVSWFSTIKDKFAKSKATAQPVINEREAAAEALTLKIKSTAESIADNPIVDTVVKATEKAQVALKTEAKLASNTVAHASEKVQEVTGDVKQEDIKRPIYEKISWFKFSKSKAKKAEKAEKLNATAPVDVMANAVKTEMKSTVAGGASVVAPVIDVALNGVENVQTVIKATVEPIKVKADAITTDTVTKISEQAQAATNGVTVETLKQPLYKKISWFEFGQSKAKKIEKSNTKVVASNAKADIKSTAVRGELSAADTVQTVTDTIRLSTDVPAKKSWFKQAVTVFNEMTDKDKYS